MLDVLFAIAGSLVRWKDRQNMYAYNNVALEKAKERGDLTWFSMDGERTVQLFPDGYRRVYVETSPDGRYDYKIDSRGWYVCNATEERNKRNTEQAKQDAKDRGWKFYITYEYCDKKGKAICWRNDDLPGMVFVESCGMFCEAEAVKKESYEKSGCAYRINFKEGGKKYYRDGVLCTPEEKARRDTAEAKRVAEAMGRDFYSYYSAHSGISNPVYKSLTKPGYFVKCYGGYCPCEYDEGTGKKTVHNDKCYSELGADATYLIRKGN